MVVAVNGSFKIPVGYFLVNGMSGVERANMINVALKRLHDIGVCVISVTCDGPSCHFTMASELGVSLKADTMMTFFKHPLSSNNVYFFLDICHMIKLVRNTLGHGHVLVDSDEGRISWDFIVSLEKLQREEGLKLGNKLTRNHINF